MLNSTTPQMLEPTIKWRQKSIGWCTVLVLANLLKEPKFMEYAENPKFRACTEKDEDELLMLCHPTLRLIEVAHSNTSYPVRLPIKFLWDLLNIDEGNGPDDVELPMAMYMLTVRLIEADIWHCVGVISLYGILYYLDPYHTEMFVLAGPEHLSKQFIDCCQIRRMALRDEDSWAIIYGERIGYELI